MFCIYICDLLTIIMNLDTVLVHLLHVRMYRHNIQNWTYITVAETTVVKTAESEF